MSETLYRVTPVDLEIRSDGRTVAGICCPFDEPSLVRDGAGGADYTEVFRFGAFAKTISESTVKFLVNHDHLNRLPLGNATTLREDPRGLYGEFKVSKTRDGDEALELIRDGVLDGLSVGFQPVKHRGDKFRGGTVERIEVKLREVSATPFPAYSGAKVLAVRSDGARLDPHLTGPQARARLLQMKANP